MEFRLNETQDDLQGLARQILSDRSDLGQLRAFDESTDWFDRDTYAELAKANFRFGNVSQFSEFGFNRGYGDSKGLWTNAPAVVKTNWPSTTLQTMLVRYDFDLQRWSGWAAEGAGEALLDPAGRLAAKPLFHDAPLAARSISHLYLSKNGSQVLELHRIGLARSPREALGLTKGTSKETVPGTVVAQPKMAKKLSASIEMLVGDETPLVQGDRISFFGDSVTWQGGYLDGVAKVVRDRRPDLNVEFFKRGINGGKSTDLRDGCNNLYGCTQKPLREVIKDDRSSVVVIYIGINDVWHQANGKGNSPEIGRAHV